MTFGHWDNSILTIIFRPVILIFIVNIFLAVWSYKDSIKRNSDVIDQNQPGQAAARSVAFDVFAGRIIANQDQQEWGSQRLQGL